MSKSTAHLKLPLYDDHKALSGIFQLQESLQLYLGYDLTNLPDSNQDLSKYLIEQKLCIEEELLEFLEACGGEHGKAFFKGWKPDHADCMDNSLYNYSDEQIKNMKFELIDIFQHLVNMSLAIGMTPQELYGGFSSKIYEVKKRKDNGNL